MEREFDFRLKVFGIRQKHTAMKIGTDAICLGAWSSRMALQAINTPKQILDIGAGTCILSLMIAQRFPTASIDAIEIDAGAIIDAKYNIEQSPWNHNIRLIHNDINLYSRFCSQQYDLIICNPPYYNASTHSQNYQRNLARYDNLDGLGIERLILLSKTLLSKDGMLYFIAPYNRIEEIRSICTRTLMLIRNVCIVDSYPNNPVRVLVQVSLYTGGYTPTIYTTLTLRKETDVYSEEYLNLISEFIKH